MARVLTSEDHDRIAAAIAAAEMATSGEIYCIVARSVATYRWMPVTVAAVAVLLTPLAVSLLAPSLHPWSLFGADWSSGNLTTSDVDAAVRKGLHALALLQVAIFVGVVALTWPAAVRLALTPPPMRRRKVMHSAHRQFLAQGLQHTTGRTGLMLFVAMAERQAVLIADVGINSKVEQAVWDETVAQLTTAAGAGDIVKGLIAAIGRCGVILTEHFPPEATPLNQLPNRVVEL